MDFMTRKILIQFYSIIILLQKKYYYCLQFIL